MAAAVLLSGYTIYAVAYGVAQAHYEQQIQELQKLVVQQAESPPIMGSVEYIHIRDGEIIYWEKNSNIVVTAGKQNVRNFLGWGNGSRAAGVTNSTTCIAVSNDATPLATWTKLPGEIGGGGFDRVNTTTITSLNATSYRSQATFTHNNATAQTLQCSGLYYNPVVKSDGELFAANTFNSVTLQENDQLIVKWDIQIT